MPAPIKHTCPKIDKAIKLAKEIQRSIDNELSDRDIRDIKSDLESLIDYFEECRQDNDYLRDWAKECEKENESLSNELEEAIQSKNL